MKPCSIVVCSIGLVRLMTKPQYAALLTTRHMRRVWLNRLAMTLCGAAMALGLGCLLWMLWDVLRLGASGLQWALFTHMTPPPGSATDTGGLANALYGSAMMVLLATCVGTPLGVLAGVYLAEYGGEHGARSKGDACLAAAARFACDLLLSAPSIVLGLFVYAVVVLPMRGFSALAGSMALALMVLPVVMHTTANRLHLVPASLREAAYALGAPYWKVTCLIALRAARPGVVTGVLLAVARIAGETAPLLFTALGNPFWNSDLLKPTASLPVTIFQFAMSPYDNWQRLAWAGVLLIVLAVLGLNMVARIIEQRNAYIHAPCS